MENELQEIICLLKDNTTSNIISCSNYCGNNNYRF